MDNFKIQKGHKLRIMIPVNIEENQHICYIHD